MNSSKEIKYGAILSYMLLIGNTVYGLFITPYILRYVGIDTYGVYKSVSSLSSTLAVIDFGLGTTMTRYIARYNAVGEKEKADNFIAMIFLQFLVIIFLLVLIGLSFFLSIDSLYANTFNQEQINVAKGLFLILLLNMSLRLLENLFFGITNGNEKFVFSNSIKLFSLILKTLLVLIILPVIKNVFVVVTAETIVALSSIVVFICYCFKVLKIKPRLKQWDKALFKESFAYTFLMFIQTIVMQFSGNVDNILIGAKISAAAVTVYSMALTIYNMYQNLSNSVANLMLPRITKRVVSGAKPDELQREVEKFGRYQYFILAAALGGIVALGKEFFYLWLGDGYEDCYSLCIILITCVTLPTVGNVTLSILRAQNKMVYRTVTLIVSCLANIIMTIVGINLWGYWGAAIGTGLASIINFVAMNYYYYKTLQFHVFRLFGNITLRTTICAIVPTVLVLLIKKNAGSSLFSFLLHCSSYMIIYIVMLYLCSMNKEEKQTIFGVLIKHK